MKNRPVAPEVDHIDRFLPIFVNQGPVSYAITANKDYEHLIAAMSKSELNDKIIQTRSYHIRRLSQVGYGKEEPETINHTIEKEEDPNTSHRLINTPRESMRTSREDLSCPERSDDS